MMSDKVDIEGMTVVVVAVRHTVYLCYPEEPLYLT